MLTLENVQAGYGNILAIKDVSLEIKEGEIITLIGANGAGKSTTLMTISGVVRCRSGKIIFNRKLTNVTTRCLLSSESHIILINKS